MKISNILLLLSLIFTNLFVIIAQKYERRLIKNLKYYEHVHFTKFTYLNENKEKGMSS